MALEIAYVGAVVDVEISSEKWSADAALFAVSADRSRIAVTPAHMGAAGPSRGIAAITKRYAGPPLPEDPDARQGVLDAYRVQRYDVEDAINGMLGRDPEMHRPPRLSWELRLSSPFGGENPARGHRNPCRWQGFGVAGAARNLRTPPRPSTTAEIQAAKRRQRRRRKNGWLTFGLRRASRPGPTPGVYGALRASPAMIIQISRRGIHAA